MGGGGGNFFCFCRNAHPPSNPSNLTSYGVRPSPYTRQVRQRSLERRHHGRTSAEKSVWLKLRASLYEAQTGLGAGVVSANPPPPVRLVSAKTPPCASSVPNPPPCVSLAPNPPPPSCASLPRHPPPLCTALCVYRLACGPLNNKTPAVAPDRLLCAPPCVCTAFYVYRRACGPLNNKTPAVAIDRLFRAPPCVRTAFYVYCLDCGPYINKTPAVAIDRLFCAPPCVCTTLPVAP